MEPLIALVAVTLALLAAGAAGVSRFRPWPVALRGGLAAMFTLTGMAHFVGLRAELVAMVPPSLPNPSLSASLAVVISSVRGRATESPSEAHSLAAPGVALPPAPHPRSR